MQTIRESIRSSGWVPSVSQTHGVIPLDIERTDLAALLRSSLEPLTRQTAASGVELRVEVMGDVPRIMIDREKIAWAVVTLVGNALRYVSQHSELVRGSEAGGGSIIVHIVHDGSAREVSVAVQDDGPGVPGDKLPHLFRSSPLRAACGWARAHARSRCRWRS